MKTRREFIKNISYSSSLYLTGSLGVPGLFSPFRHNSFKVENPYSGVDWDHFQQVASATHVHVNDQEALNKVYREMKLRHIPISNYYPSAPYYPLDKISVNHFKFKQDFGLIFNEDSIEGKERWKKGEFIEGPIHWNKIIMDENKGWYKKLPKELQQQLPFKTGSALYPKIPADVIISPNAEHHSFTNSSLHACSPGSLYSSGSFDVHNKFKTVDHGYCYGTGRPWQEVFAEMLDKLVFADGGGITINHPVWSSLSFDEVCQMLDFDERVLGIEVYNDTCETSTGNPQTGWAVALWDQILSTGRSCRGFFVPDHTATRGRNILLVPEYNERECLRAYRHGAFYGAIEGSGLRFNKIKLKKDKLEVALNKPGNIRFVTNQDQEKKDKITHAEFTIPTDNAKKSAIVYVRVEAEDELGEKIFSQPIRFI